MTRGGNGALGAPGTSVLFGNSDVNDGWQSGARVRLGYWFDPGKRSSVDAHFFMLGQRSADFNAASDGATLWPGRSSTRTSMFRIRYLSQPPGLLNGRISMSETSRLYGAGGAYRSELCAMRAFGSVTGFAGYRYLHLRDKLQKFQRQASPSGDLLWALRLRGPSSSQPPTIFTVSILA